MGCGCWFWGSPPAPLSSSWIIHAQWLEKREEAKESACACAACLFALIPWKLDPKRSLRCSGTNYLCWSALLRMLTRLIRAYFLTGCPSVVKWLFTIKQLTLDGDGGSEARGALSAATTQLDAWRLWFMWGQLLRWAWHDHGKSVQIVFVFLFVCELVMMHCYEWGDFLLHWSGNYLLLLAIKSGFSMNLIFFLSSSEAEDLRTHTQDAISRATVIFSL